MNNLIGISGKIGSGKDTVGRILQEIQAERDNPDWEKTCKRIDLHAYSGYQIKKCADKLKDMVCLLIGCTREQLEDQEFKNKELGEEWERWCVYTMGEVIDIFLTEEELLKEYPISEDYDHTCESLTPRLLLQLIGTDCGRDIIHPQIWVNALFADYNTPDKVEVLYNGAVDESESYTTGSNWIITDCRFPNEAQAVKQRGGIVIRVNRGKTPVPEGALKAMVDRSHPSETSLDNYEFDHVIDNNGSIEELVEKVKQLKLV